MIDGGGKGKKKKTVFKWLSRLCSPNGSWSNEKQSQRLWLVLFSLPQCMRDKQWLCLSLPLHLLPLLLLFVLAAFGLTLRLSPGQPACSELIC